MTLDFAIHADKFIGLFSAYLAFFVLLWTISYAIKVIR